MVKKSKININLREAIGLDARKISKCNKESLPVWYTPRQYVTYILNKDYLVFIVEKDKDIIGYSLVRKENFNNGYKGHILSFAVLEKYRSKGIGKDLMDFTYDIICKKFNVIYLTLNVMVSNNRAIHFYKREGFKKKYKLKHYYGKKKHGIMMIKQIKQFSDEDMDLSDELKSFLK